METTKVLHVIYSLSSGGIESLVSTLYENIDREKVQFDFAVLSPVDPIHKNKLERLGANIYFLSDLGLHNSIQAKIRWRISGLTNYNKLISSNTYDAVHCHMFNRYSLYILSAKLKGVKKRIVHSHTAGAQHENILTKYIRRARNIIGFEWLVTNKIACSIEAAKWLYGDRNVKENKVQIIYNGIDMEVYSPDNYDKEYIIKKYNFKKGIHFFNVGRFSIQKNQMFLLEVFKFMIYYNKDMYLHIVGFGKLKKQLMEKVNDLGLMENVIFYDHDTNIPELLSAMDFFLLPSLWEGFPITAIESQSMNVPIYISEKVTKEVDMGLATYLSIDNGPKYWADYITNEVKNETYLKNIKHSKKREFDITRIAKQFEKLYLS